MYVNFKHVKKFTYLQYPLILHMAAFAICGCRSVFNVKIFSLYTLNLTIIYQYVPKPPILSITLHNVYICTYSLEFPLGLTVNMKSPFWED